MRRRVTSARKRTSLRRPRRTGGTLAGCIRNNRLGLSPAQHNMRSSRRRAKSTVRTFVSARRHRGKH